MTKLVGKLAVLCVVLGLVSCASEEIEPVAYSDAFILAKKIDGEVKYGLGLYTYANVAMNSVVAESESGEKYSLESEGTNKFEYYLESAAENFSVEEPETGNYTFRVIFFDGREATVMEDLLGNEIDPTEFTKCAYNGEKKQIEITWVKNSDTDYAVVALRDAEGKLVYFSNALSAAVTSSTISASGWVSGNSPEQGATYTVELGLYVKEGGVSNYLESKALTVQDVVWGE